MSFDLGDNFGEELKSKNGKVNSKDVKAKYIGIYFSAHWCPPCRGFTPVLCKFYEDVKTAFGEGHLEIIFVSSDRDEEAADEYYADMPWICLPFDKQDVKDNLAKKYAVTGIPKFVLLNGEDGTLISDNARGDIASCKDVKSFKLWQS